MRNRIIFVVVALASIFSGVAIYSVTHRNSSIYSCIAGPDELCASDVFYGDYQRWKALQTEVQAGQRTSAIRDLQEKQDQFNGMTTRLAGQVPQGYNWDEKKQRFVKSVPPPALASTPPTTAVPTKPTPAPISGNAAKK